MQKRHSAERSQRLAALSVVIAVTAFVAFLAQCISLSWRDAKHMAADNAASIAMSLDWRLGRSLEAIDTALLASAHAVAITDDPVPVPDLVRAALFGSLVTRGLDGVAITNAAGTTIAMSNRTLPPLDLSDRDYFAAHRDDPNLGLLISQPVIGRNNGVRSTMLSRRIDKPGGVFAGVAVGSVELTQFDKVFETFKMRPGSKITILKTDGTILLRWPGSETKWPPSITGPRAIAELRNSPSGSFESISAGDGVYRLFAYRKVGDFPLLILVGLSEHEVFVDWASSLLPSAGVIGLLLLAIIGGACLLGREWGRRVEAEHDTRRRATALSVSIARLDALFQHSPDALQVIAVQPDGHFIWEAVSPLFLELYDIQTDVEGAAPHDCLPTEIADHVIGCWRACVQARTPLTFQYTMNKAGRRCDLEKSLAPVFDPTGRICRLVGSIRDVTERNRMQQTLQQSQKMEIVGQLTAGVAHDFNNLLQAIIGTLDVMDHMLGAHEAAQQCLSVVRRAAFRGTSLTNRLLTVSRKQNLEPALVDIEEALQELKELSESTLGPRIRLETDIAAHPGPILVDPSQLMTCLINLVVNARDAMPGGGSIQISAETAHASDPGAPPGLAGKFVLIRVTDDGCGMQPDVLAHACEPFFTTKELGKGSGLGLAMVQGFAGQSGGAIKVASEFGRGTSVEIWLPLARESLVRLQAPRPERVSGSGRILVADDDDEVGAALSLMLTQGGYRVTLASTGEQALALLEGSDHFDVLLADYAMPGMSGAELIARTLQRFPAMPVLLITGYNQKALHDDDLPVGVRILRKPLGRDELLLQLRAAMNAYERLPVLDETGAPFPSNVFRFTSRNPR
jgi:PAS domain S-box-containing protein